MDRYDGHDSRKRDSHHVEQDSAVSLEGLPLQAGPEDDQRRDWPAAARSSADAGQQHLLSVKGNLTRLHLDITHSLTLLCQ
jgi:hypothetical protein